MNILLDLQFKNNNAICMIEEILKLAKESKLNSETIKKFEDEKNKHKLEVIGINKVIKNEKLSCDSKSNYQVPDELSELEILKFIVDFEIKHNNISTINDRYKK